MKLADKRFQGKQSGAPKQNSDNIGIGAFKGDKHETSANTALIRQDELIKSLDEHLKEKDRLQSEIKTREDRFYKREIEYRKIINDLEIEIKKKTASKNFDMQIGMKQRNCLLNEINVNIDNIQLKTSKILVDQEKDIIKFFNNKIFEIKKQFEEERIKKGKKEQDYIEKENQLISELEWIKNIAQKIDDENHSLMKQYMDLKAQYQTQENDREMLLKELIMKKKKNAILKSQIEQYQNLYNEVSKEVDETNNIQNMSQQLGKSMHSSPNKSRINNRSQQATKSSQFIDRNQMEHIEKHHIQYVQRADNTLRTLQNTLIKEQKRISKLKAMYVKEQESQSDLEIIIRNIVNDIKADMQEAMQQQTSKYGIKNNLKEIDHNNKQLRENLIESLLNNDKILTIIYDKTFYPEIKNIDSLNSSIQSKTELGEKKYK